MAPHTGRLLTGLLGAQLRAAQQGCGAETVTGEEVSGDRDQQRSRKASGERACLPNSTRTHHLRSGDFAGAGPGEQPKRTLETLPGSVSSKQILLIRYPMGSKEEEGPGSPHRRGGTACSQGQRYRPQTAGSATLHPCPETYRRSLHQDTRSCDHSYPDLLSPFFLFFLFWAGQSCPVFLLKL